MKESVKAILWSVFIFPGGGHLYFKKWFAGVIFAAIATVALIVILARVVERASKIAEKIVLGEIPLDLAVIMEQVSMQTTLGDPTLDTAWYALIGIWIVAALDAFRLGRAVDKQQPEKE
ncbi:MAG: hypothetical protein GY806_16545 [Gammaproteobacteria bacterium]|nr:hypothetical protein [Gammaproteobacteria bacterium]